MLRSKLSLLAAIAIVLIGFVGQTAFAQHDFTISNMPIVPQRNYINPAFVPQSQLWIGVPAISSVYVNAGTSGYKYSDIIQKDGDSLVINMDNALSKMAKTNYMSVNAAIDLIAFGFGNGRYYVGVNMTERVMYRQLLPKSLMEFVWKGNGAFLGETVDFSRLNMNASHFREYGVSFAYKINPDISVGAKVKYLYGMENISTSVNQLDIFTDENTFDITANADMQINSSGLLDDDPFGDLDQDLGAYLFQRNNHGYALDFGAAWKIDEKWGVSASVLDLGQIFWKNKPVNYKINDANFTYQGVDLSTFLDQNDSTDVFQELLDTLESTFNPVEDSVNYSTGIPSRMYVSGTYNVTEDHQAALHFYGEFYKGHFEPGFALHWTSRFTDIFSLSASYSYFNRNFTNLGLGFALTLGPWQWYMGVDNIIAPMIPQHSKNFHVHTGWNLVFRYKDKAKKKVSDRDNDGIPDAFDECPDEFGLEIHQGCPDRDGDGLRDIEDVCPDTAGPVENNGCPWGDADNDGLLDNVDSCKTVPGPLANNGCPWGDADEDGVFDNLDSCVTVAGPAANNGCPWGDTDGDGVLDNEDPCPTVPGPVENKGCPYGDKDGDGILDNDDKCPEIPGPKDNDGCPYADSDQDGVIDKDDDCPRTPGPASNKGCPVIEKEEQEVLNTAFENLEFETGSDVIKASSYESLNELADLLKKKPDWRLKISGHTDNVGSESSNLRLSQKRSTSVAAFLVNRGITESRFVVEWFGESKPIYPNDTAEGRQKNRRVEMEVVFE